MLRGGRGGETASKIGSSAAAFQSFWGQLENKRVQTPRDTCAEFGEACVAGSGRFRGNVGRNPLRCHLLLPFGPPQCWRSSTMTPSRPPGPWFLAQAPSKLSIRPASTSTRPPWCDDFQRFERAKSSAGLGAHPPYCADRFCDGRVLASRRRAHRSWWGLRAKWPHAKCGAAALFCGVPPRLTPWAVRNSLGLPTGAFWLRTRPKKFLV